LADQIGEGLRAVFSGKNGVGHREDPGSALRTLTDATPEISALLASACFLV
jgi:hypothetical protein